MPAKCTKFEDNLETIKELFRQEKSSKEVSEILDINQHTLVNKMKRLGLSRVDLKHEGRKQVAKKIAELYNSDKTQEQIQKELNLDKGKVRYYIEHLCKRYEIELKTKCAKWCDDELVKLMKLTSVFSYKKVGEIIGKTESAVDHYMNRKSVGRSSLYTLNVMSIENYKKIILKSNKRYIPVLDIILCHMGPFEMQNNISYASIIRNHENGSIIISDESYRICKSMLKLSISTYEVDASEIDGRIRQVIEEYSDNKMRDLIHKRYQLFKEINKTKNFAGSSTKVYGESSQGNTIRNIIKI